jgi:hypothetical protein
MKPEPTLVEKLLIKGYIELENRKIELTDVDKKILKELKAWRDKCNKEDAESLKKTEQHIRQNRIEVAASMIAEIRTNPGNFPNKEK